jgi:hypothetical protein
VEAFDRILGRIGGTQQPSLLYTDKDAAFGVVNGEMKSESAFSRNLESEEINQKLKVWRNDIAPVDAAIYKIKNRIKKNRINNPGQGWSGLISRLEASLNKKPMKSLFGSAPNEVATNDELKFQVMEKQAENIKTNFEEDAKFKSRLPIGCGFRAPKVQPRALTAARADVQRYEGQVREVARNDFGEVVDTSNPAKTPFLQSSSCRSIASQRRSARRTKLTRAIRGGLHRRGRFYSPSLMQRCWELAGEQRLDD